MNGHILENTPIAVDFWHKSGNSQWIHFLSHCHMDHLVNLTSSWREPIYTSKFNVWFLKTRLMVNPKFLIELSVGDSHLIEVPKIKKTFTVTLIDANHCPGSVMFLFEGEFGTILYTGDFRYDPVMVENEALAKVIQNEMLDVLYLDNTYASPQCTFPSREDAANEIVDIIRKYPDHQILIGFRNLGKESLLRKIALELNETIFVDLERLEILEYLQYEDVFTTDSRSSRIHVVPQFGLPNEHWNRRRFRKGAVISILPTALYDCGIRGCYIPFKNSEVHGIHVVPYSDHSPYSELYTFVSIVKPCKLLPIVKTQKPSRIDSSFYWDVLKTVTNIPQSIMKLCRVRRKRRLSENSAKELDYGGGDLGVQSDVKRVQHSAKRRKMLTSRSVSSKVSRAFKRKGVQYDSSESDNSSNEADCNSEDSSSDKSKEGSSVIGKCRNESVSKRNDIQCESFLLEGIHSDHTYACEAIGDIGMSNATHNVSCKPSKKDDLVEISVRQPNSEVVRVKTSSEVGPMLKNVRVLLHKNFYIGYSSYENNMPTFRLPSRSKTVDRHVQTEPNLSLNQIKEEGMSDDESVAAPKTVICSSKMHKERVQDAEHNSDSETVILSSEMHKERVQDAEHISHSMHKERVQDAENISHSETVTLLSEMHNERVQDAEHISHSETVTLLSEMHNEIVQNANSENNDVDNDEHISDAETVIFSPEIHYEIVDDDEPISRANSEICSSEVRSEVKCNTEIELGEGFLCFSDADHKSNIVIEGETERVFDSEVKCNTEIEVGEDFLRSSDSDHKNNIVTEGETEPIVDANTVIRSSEICNGVKCKTEIEFDEQKNVYSNETYQENETQEICSISQESLKLENPIAYANSTTEPLITQIKVESDVISSSTNLLDPSIPCVCENQQTLTNDGLEAVESHVRHVPSLDKTQQNQSNDGTDTPHVVESYNRHVPSVDKSQQNQSKNGTDTPRLFNPYIRLVSILKSQQSQSVSGTDTPRLFNPYIRLVSIDKSQQSQSVSGTRNLQSAESNIVSVPAVQNQQDQFRNRTDTSQSAGPDVRYVPSADENAQNQSKSGTDSVQSTDPMSVPFVHEWHGGKTVKVKEYNFTRVDKVQRTQSRNGRSAIQLNDVQLSTGDILDCNNENNLDAVTSVDAEMDSDIQCSAEFSSRVGFRNESAQHSGNVQESGVVEEQPAEMPEHQNPENSSEEIFHTCQSQTELNVLQSMAGTERENEIFFTASDETDSYSPKGNIKHKTTSVQAEKEVKKIIRREFTLRAGKLHTHSKSNNSYSPKGSIKHKTTSVQAEKEVKKIMRYVPSADENEQNQSKSGTDSVQTTDHMSVPFVHEWRGEKTVQVEEYNFTRVDKVQQTQSRNGRSAIQLTDVPISTDDILDCNNENNLDAVTSVDAEMDSDIQCSAEFSSRVGLGNQSAQHSGNVQESGVVEEQPAEIPEHQNPENSSEEIFHTCQSQTELNVLQSMAGTERENEIFFTASDETDSYSPKGNIKHKTTSVQAEKEVKKIIRRKFTLQAGKLHTRSKSNNSYSPKRNIKRKTTSVQAEKKVKKIIRREFTLRAEKEVKKIIRYVPSADENEQNQSKSGTDSVQTTDHMSVPFVHEWRGEKTVQVEEYNFTRVDKVQQTQSRNGRSAIQLTDVPISTGDILDCNNENNLDAVTSVDAEMDSDIQCSAEFSSRVGLGNKSVQHSGNVQESGVVEEQPAEMPEHQNPENSSEEIFHTCQSQTALNVLQSMAGTQSEKDIFFTASDETDSYSPKGNIKHKTTSVQAEKEVKKIIRRKFTLQAGKLHTHSNSNKDVLENVTRCEEYNDTSDNRDGCLFSNNRLESPGTNKDNHKNKCHKKNSNIRCKSIHCNPRLQTDLAPGHISRKNKIIGHTEWGTNNEYGKFSERHSEKNYWEGKSIDIFALINARITVGESELENNYCSRSSIDVPETRHECLSNDGILDSPRYTKESDTCHKKNSNIKSKPVNSSPRKKTDLAPDHISRKNKILSITEQEATNEYQNPSEKDSEIGAIIDVSEIRHECLSNDGRLDSSRCTKESDTCHKKNSNIKSKPIYSSLRKNTDLAPDHISRKNKILSDTERKTTNEDQNSGEKDSEIEAVIDVPETCHECLSNDSARYTEESDTCHKKNSHIKCKSVNSSLRKNTDLAPDHIPRRNKILCDTEQERTNEDQNSGEKDSEIEAVIDVPETRYGCLSNDDRLDSPRYTTESDTCHKKNSNIKFKSVNSSLRKKTDLATDHTSRKNKILSDTERKTTNEDQNSGEKDSEIEAVIDVPETCHECLSNDSARYTEESDTCHKKNTNIKSKPVNSSLRKKTDLATDHISRKNKILSDTERKTTNEDQISGEKDSEMYYCNRSSVDIPVFINTDTSDLSEKESEDDYCSISSSIVEISELMEKYDIKDIENESGNNDYSSIDIACSPNLSKKESEEDCYSSNSSISEISQLMGKYNEVITDSENESEKNHCTSGSKKNCCTSGTEKNYCKSGLEKNYCKSGLEKNCCTSGSEKNCCTSRLEKNCCTSGSEKNCCSESSKTHYECFLTDNSKKESAATNRDDDASHRWHKKNSNAKHKSVCCRARKQANDILRKNKIIRDIERGTSSEHEREPEKSCSKGIVKNSEKVSGKNYRCSSSLDVTSLFDTCISDSEELSERDCERNFWDASSVDVSALTDAVVAGEKLFFSLHHRKTNEEV